jgi:hypothetical protein
MSLFDIGRRMKPGSSKNVIVNSDVIQESFLLPGQNGSFFLPILLQRDVFERPGCESTLHM